MKKIAFICVHNSCRSQIAEALGKHIAGEIFESYSAGTETKPQINQDAVRIMKRLYGIDMEQEQYSKLVSDIPSPDIAISMGCNVGCPFIGRSFDDNWGLEDPTGKSEEEFIKIIKEIEKKILELVVNELFSSGYNCSQIVASLFAKKYGMHPEEVKRIACGFGGGMRQAEVCGAVTGALMVIGMKYGNWEAFDTKAKTKCYEKTVEFEKEFQNIEGSIICRDLLKCGISTTEGFHYAMENNLCPKICQKIILSAILILKDSGY